MFPQTRTVLVSLVLSCVGYISCHVVDGSRLSVPHIYQTCVVPTCILSFRVHSSFFFETDVKDESINLENTTLKFKGKSDSKEYEVDIEFFKAVDAEGSTYKVLPRSVQMHVMKKKVEDGEEEEEFWPRLLKDKALEKNQVRVALYYNEKVTCGYHLIQLLATSFVC